jgi:hypothetical protein
MTRVSQYAVFSGQTVQLVLGTKSSLSRLVHVPPKQRHWPNSSDPHCSVTVHVAHLLCRQDPVRQSFHCWHDLLVWHLAHDPPQSVSVSSPLRRPSSHRGVAGGTGGAAGGEGGGAAGDGGFLRFFRFFLPPCPASLSMRPDNPNMLPPRRPITVRRGIPMNHARAKSSKRWLSTMPPHQAAGASRFTGDEAEHHRTISTRPGRPTGLHWE